LPVSSEAGILERNSSLGYGVYGEVFGGASKTTLSRFEFESRGNY
jgi:hypothetical protein